MGRRHVEASGSRSESTSAINEDDVTFNVKPGKNEKKCRSVCDHEAANVSFAGVCASLSVVVVAVCGHRP